MSARSITQPSINPTPAWPGKLEARGKFFFSGADKVLLKGVTYGPFASWQGCVEARPYPYNVDDTPASGGSANTGIGFGDPATMFTTLPFGMVTLVRLEPRGGAAPPPPPPAPPPTPPPGGGDERII